MHLLKLDSPIAAAILAANVRIKSTVAELSALCALATLVLVLAELFQ